MRRFNFTSLILALASMLATTPAWADNCGSFDDCGGVMWGIAGAMGIAIMLVGLVMLFPILGAILSDLLVGKGILEFVTGKDVITGQKLSLIDRALGVLPGGVPAKGATQAAKGAAAAAVQGERLVEAELRIAQEKAILFYKNTKWADTKIMQHLDGIDFSKPVEIVSLKKGTLVMQYQIPGRPVGNYFAPLGAKAETLGINPIGRVPSVFEIAEDTAVLRSTASTVIENGNTNNIFDGGGIQYFSWDNASFIRAKD
jgi:hypothetical protein